jgi:hypothetical protein
MLARERPLLSSLARRALYPSHPPLPSRDGFRGLWAARLSGKPAASHRQQSGVVARAIGRQLDPRPPRPREVPDEGQLLHHLRPSPPPPGRRLTGNGGLYHKQSKHRHINRVEVGVGDGVGVEVGEVDGESGLKKKVYKAYPIAALSISNDG